MPRPELVKVSSNGTDSDAPNFSLYWLFSILIAVAFAFALAVYPPVLGEITTTPPNWALMLGRFHPIVVHLPIGILMLVFIFELFCLLRGGERRWGPSSLLALFIATAGACQGVVFGILLARSGGYEGPNFFMHQALCTAMAAVMLIALFLRLSAMSSGGRGVMFFYRLFLMLSLGLMSIGAHFGANMVHGSKYLTEYAPPQVAEAVHGVEKWILSFVPKPKEEPAPEEPKTEPSPTPAPTPDKPTPAPGDKTPPAAPASLPTASAAGDDKLVFQHVILPILDNKCNSCHNEDKSKGDLRMDTYELMMKGGENGDNIIAGKPDDSLSIQRVMLPADDDEHMPPDGKPQLTKEELALFKWWIQAGASATQKLKDAAIPADLKPAVDAILTKPAT